MTEQTCPENCELKSIEIIIPYIESYGSVRLRNCIFSAIDEGRMPYSSLDDYLSDPVRNRITNLLRIQNLGRKTAIEFDELVGDFVLSNRVNTELEPESPSSIKQESEMLLLDQSDDQTPVWEKRYSNLVPRELDVIERRYSINRVEKQTLDEIGQYFGVTRERIRQIESKALKKLRTPNISIIWKTYIDTNLELYINTLFEDTSVILDPKPVSGEIELSISIVYQNVYKFLEDRAQKFENFWVKPNANLLEIQSTRNRLKAIVSDPTSLPLSIREISRAYRVNISIVEAAVSALDEHKIYNGWVISGSATSRKKRIVNILNLFDKKEIPSPVSLWDIKVAYWSHYDDKCNGRDLLISLQDHNQHFVNLHELGWLCLTVESNSNALPVKLKSDISDELYCKPVKKGMGLANSVYELFEKHGPQRLSDAAEIFQQEYPEYATSSMYPMLVYYPVFFRFSPGVIGIQVHLKDAALVQKARQILLNRRDLDLYLYSRDAGPPKLHYPLWDSEMEWFWAEWLEEQKDFSRLGSLLIVARIENWPIDQSKKDEWVGKKRLLDSSINIPEIRILSERFIDTGILRTALAALSVYGFVNWMYLNQAIGWRVETTRVVLVLAVLIKTGVLKPTGTWNKPHLITKHGRLVLKKIFGRSINSPHIEPKSIKDFLNESVETNNEFGWVTEYDFEQLLNQISDISGQQNGDWDQKEGQSSNIESEYEGFMGNALKLLIED